MHNTGFFCGGNSNTLNHILYQYQSTFLEKLEKVFIFFNHNSWNLTLVLVKYFIFFHHKSWSMYRDTQHQLSKDNSLFSEKTASLVTLLPLFFYSFYLSYHRPISLDKIMLMKNFIGATPCNVIEFVNYSSGTKSINKNR